MKRFWAAGLITGVSLLLGGAGWYMHSYALSRQNRTMIKQAEGKASAAVEEMNEQSRRDYEWALSLAPESLQIISFDGLQLRASFLQAENKTRRTVILAHGYRAEVGLRDMASLARMYHEEFGFNVLCPDNRAHGASEGNIIGFGWTDRKDYLGWIDLIIEREKQAEIVLHGVSMGGAVVLSVSGESLPVQVKGIISDCAFTSMHDQLAHQLKRSFGLPPFPLMPAASLINKWYAGHFFKEASALKQVKKASVPILYIHGGEDYYVPTSMVYQLHEQTSAEKSLYVAKGAGHGQAFSEDEQEYKKQIASFIKKQVNDK